jgi:foldase protein PrsA
MPKADRLVAGLAAAMLAATLVGCNGGGGDVVTVNGTPITKSQLDNELESSPAALGTLQNMVRSELLNQYAKKNNITVSDAEIAKQEDAIKANFPAGQWDEMLKARGLTEQKVHDALREHIIMDKAVGKDVKVTDAQIKQYFDKNHAAFDKPEQIRVRHILVPTLQQAQKIEADLKAGKDFSAEAKQYSMDPGSKDKGGELGWVRHGQMVPTFDQAAFSLPVGKISAPVKSPFGYHIIQVEEKQPAVKATLANTHDKIADTLRQQQEAPLFQPFLQDLQSKANIQVQDPRFQGAFPTPVPSTAPAATGAAPATSSSPQ